MRMSGDHLLTFEQHREDEDGVCEKCENIYAYNSTYVSNIRTHTSICMYI